MTRKKGDQEKKRIVDESNYVKEIKSLAYIPAKWLPGFEPPEEDTDDEDKLGDHGTRPRRRKPIGQAPLVKAHFMALQKDPKSQYPKKVGPLNPQWVKHFFKGVFVQLVMLRPNHFWPLVIGNSRHELDKAPPELLVSTVKIKYPQYDRDQCFIRSVASSLYYCGLKKESSKLCSQSAHKFEFITKKVAVKEIQKLMRETVPCIGTCTVYNVRSKNGTIKELTIKDLIEQKTRFPTLVIPYGKDGSNNHSFVVVDDLIFDSTQTHALKLCQKSFDWICGDDGMGSINVALRFNASYGTKERLQHEQKKNW